MQEHVAAAAPRTAMPVAALETLLVEDSEFDRTRIRRLKKRIPIQINLTEAASLSEMRDRINERNFDLVLIDYHLGDADGLQAMRLLKQSPLQKDAGAIMITGNEKVDIAASAFRDGCDDFIAKSTISAALLHQTIERVMSNVHERHTERIKTHQLREEIRGAVVASLKGEEAQSMISEAVQAARPSLSTSHFDQAAAFAQIVTVDDDDEFRFV